MSGYLNRVTLIGNLGRDPEIRTTQAGNKIAGLSLATRETWTDKRSGERVERTEWHRIVIFNEGSRTSPSAICARAARSWSKASYRPATGPITRALSGTPPKSCCRASAGCSRCSASRANKTAARHPGKLQSASRTERASPIPPAATWMTRFPSDSHTSSALRACA